MFSRVMLFTIGAFIFGVVISSFVFSQTGPIFSTTPPSSGVYHTADQVVCNGCVTGNSLGTDSVNSGKILDNEILDQDISTGANIKTAKLSAYGGHFVQSISFSGAQLRAIVPNSNAWGVSNWASHRLHVVCDSGASNKADLNVYGGFTSFVSNGGGSYNYNTIYNDYIVYLWSLNTGSGIVTGLPGDGWSKVYEFSFKGVTTSLNGARTIYIRVDPTNTAQLELGQVVNNAGGSGLGAIASYWTCLIDQQ